MSWMDALLGRTKPVKSSLDQLFGLSTADITLQTELELPDEPEPSQHPAE